VVASISGWYWVTTTWFTFILNNLPNAASTCQTARRCSIDCQVIATTSAEKSMAQVVSPLEEQVLKRVVGKIGITTKLVAYSWRVSEQVH